MKEIIVEDDTLITSKTDLKGFITYANDYFVKYSGYTMRELIYKNHNIIRHPHMPKCAFKVLWDTVQSGKEFFAFVKNRCKDGDYYWVFANITPSYNNQNQIIGYYSVRRKPIRKYLPLMEDLYKKLCEIEKKDGIDAGLEELLRVVNSYNVGYNELIFKLQNDEL